MLFLDRIALIGNGFLDRNLFSSQLKFRFQIGFIDLFRCSIWKSLCFRSCGCDIGWTSGFSVHSSYSPSLAASQLQFFRRFHHFSGEASVSSCLVLGCFNGLPMAFLGSAGDGGGGENQFHQNVGASSFCVL